MEKLTLIKVGGKIVEEEATLHALLDRFADLPGHKVMAVAAQPPNWPPVWASRAAWWRADALLTPKRLTW